MFYINYIIADVVNVYFLYQKAIGESYRFDYIVYKILLLFKIKHFILNWRRQKKAIQWKENINIVWLIK